MSKLMASGLGWASGLIWVVGLATWANAQVTTAPTLTPPRAATRKASVAAKVDAADEVKPDEKPGAPADAPTETTETNAKPDEETDEPTVRRPTPPPPDPRYMRLHLLDGSVIAGKLSISELPVETEYGKLSIPIASIRSFVPGLESHPQVGGELARLIESLGSDDFKTREQAHRDLAQRGLAIKRVLEDRQDDTSAERRRHIQQLLKDLEEQESSSDEGSEQPQQPWIDSDTIVTQRFTLVGRITHSEFQVESKYGPLVVKLADVVRGERDSSGRDAVRKAVTVLGNQLVQRGFKSSGIRVEAGDRVTIRAQGNVVMTPWGGGQVSTPDGGQHYGWYVPNEIPGGALVVRVGDGGKVQKAGSKVSFVAKSSGLLQFAVAMAAEYSQEGYQYPGQYDVNVRVDPR